MARYSVMKRDPPPATRFKTPKSPPPPPNWVWVVIWMELLIHESSPASEMMDSLGSSDEFENGHGGAGNAALHGGLLGVRVYMASF